MKFKSIMLLPTPFELHVFVHAKEEKESLFEAMHIRYGADTSYYRDEFDDDYPFVSMFNPTKESLSGSGKVIVMRLFSIEQLSSVVHEIPHVIFDLSKLCGLGNTHKSQEWFAYMTDYLFEQISEQTVYHQLYSKYEEI